MISRYMYSPSANKFSVTKNITNLIRNTIPNYIKKKQKKIAKMAFFWFIYVHFFVYSALYY